MVLTTAAMDCHSLKAMALRSKTECLRPLLPALGLCLVVPGCTLLAMHMARLCLAANSIPKA